MYVMSGRTKTSEEDWCIIHGLFYIDVNICISQKSCCISTVIFFKSNGRSCDFCFLQNNDNISEIYTHYSDHIVCPK